ncbi:MAG TPA: response regulator [Vicinamibacterales bacterium]|jgi:FixJ family two-component response regulator
MNDDNQGRTGLIHIVDDEEYPRTATARLLSAYGFEVRTYVSAVDFLKRFVPDGPGCLVLDVQMEELTGLELQTVLNDREDSLSIVFLSGRAEIPDSVLAIRRGAIDFLTKPLDGDVLAEAVSRGLARSAARQIELTRQHELRRRYERLTPREREVLQHLISGQLNKQAAADLNISERTIKAHRAQVFSKMEVESIAELVRVAEDLQVSPAKH